DNCPRDLARNLASLLDDQALHAELAARGQARAKALLRWDTERHRLLAAYDLALAGRKPVGATTAAALSK
ncbi:MAG: hypothetical protein C0484_27925, partial [Rhodospirillum sp.]|nr:hypothetical protein [Rhodospirillum sp.]